MKKRDINTFPIENEIKNLLLWGVGTEATVTMQQVANNNKLYNFILKCIKF